MPPSVDTGELVNTEELQPLKVPETVEEAKAKPEDVIAQEENKNDKTEESAGSEKSNSDLAQSSDSTPPVPDPTPPGEMPGNAVAVKEDKCEDLVEQSDNQNKPDQSVTTSESEEVRAEETIKESEQSEVESEEKSTGGIDGQNPVPAESEAKEKEVVDDKSEVDVKEPQNTEKIAEESEKSTTEMETSDRNPGEVTEPEIIENKSEESDRSSSETSKDLKDHQADPQEEKSESKDIERESSIDKADSSCGEKEIPDTVLEDKAASNDTQCELDLAKDSESNQEKKVVVEDNTNEQLADTEQEEAENETRNENEKEIQNKTEEETPVTVERPAGEEIKPVEDEVRQETKVEVNEEVKVTPSIKSPAKDAASEGADSQTSPTLSKNSYDATKEEIEDSINFIKNRLSVADPKIPSETTNEENIKKAQEEPQLDTSIIEKEQEHCEAKDVVKKEEKEEKIQVPTTNTPAVSPKKNTEVEITKKDSSEDADADLEVAVVECIPPVRPERQKKQSVKIPEWTPPKDDFLSYLFSCFKPRNCD